MGTLRDERLRNQKYKLELTRVTKNGLWQKYKTNKTKSRPRLDYMTD